MKRHCVVNSSGLIVVLLCAIFLVHIPLSGAISFSGGDVFILTNELLEHRNTIVTGNDTNTDDPLIADEVHEVEDMSVPAWVEDGGFLILPLAVYASLWASSLVCEDYFVPAMSKLCLRFGISDDTAGATLLAMGTSAPQLFISLVSIFITKSSLGLGTAIGSVLFNHLCVCGVCALNAPDAGVALDWKILWRDSVFYCISLIMLVWVLEGSFIEAVLGLGNSSQKRGRVEVHALGALSLVAVYFVYVAVCGYYAEISTICGGTRKKYLPREGVSSAMSCCYRMVAPFASLWGSGDHRGSEWTVLQQEDDREAPLLSSGGSSGSMGFDILSFTDDLETAAITSRKQWARAHPSGGSGGGSVADSSAGDLPLTDFKHIVEEPSTELYHSLSEMNDIDTEKEAEENAEDNLMCTADFTLDASSPSSKPGTMVKQFSREVQETAPSSVPASIIPRTISGQYQCWLLKRSSFYSRLGISGRKWQLRFFVLDDSGWRYFRSPADRRRARYINIFEATSIRIPGAGNSSGSSSFQQCIDPSMLVFHVDTPEKTLALRALTPEVWRRLVSILRRRVAIYQSYPEPLRRSMAQMQGKYRPGTQFVGSGYSWGGALPVACEEDRLKLDYVGDTISHSIDATGSGPGSASSNEWEHSSEEGGSEDSDNDFDETANVWDELAMYSDAAGRENSTSSSGSIGGVSTSVRAHIAAKGIGMNLTSALLKAIATLSRVSAQLLRPLKWSIRRTIPSVLAGDVDEDPFMSMDAQLDDMNDNGTDEGRGGPKIRLHIKKRLRVSTIRNSISLRLMCTICACMGWMGVLSYVMAISCEYLGHLVGLTSAVTGLTFVSAGTSFPSLLTSLIVSYQGQGRMAISNALGSNVFCILIGLGLPWSIAIMADHGRPYDSIQDDGVVASTVLLIFILAGFLCLLFATQFVLHRWHGYLMVSTYVLIMVYLFMFTSDQAGMW